MNRRPIAPSLAALGILFAWAAASADQTLLLDRLAESRRLYESAEYDRALAAMETIDAESAPPELARDRALYQALCLFALDLKAPAASRIEAVFRIDPLFRPSSDLSPRVQSFVGEVRARVRPSLAQEHYQAGKMLYDSKRYSAALKEFTLVLELVNEERSIAGPSALSDVSTLAEGFRDLAERSVAAARSAASEALPIVVPPAILDQTLPPWPANVPPSALERLTGVIEIVVSARGDVGAVNVLTSIHPVYDKLLIAAARRWRYRPATRDGEAVAYVKRLSVSVVAAASSRSLQRSVPGSSGTLAGPPNSSSERSQS